MPPPKHKLYQKTGKVKNIQAESSGITSRNGRPAPESSRITNHAAQHQNETSSTTNASASEPSDADRQFELELCWCIQAMETSLTAGKLNEKQSNIFNFQF